MIIAARGQRYDKAMKAKPQPDFHALMRPPHRASLPSELSARLRLLAQQEETPAARSEIEAALACPWWGLRVLAIRAIGHWAGGQGKAAAGDRAWLGERARRPLPDLRELWRLPHGDALRWQALETETARLALSPHVTEQDADWILDLWFAASQRFNGLHTALLSKLPPGPIEARLRREIDAGTPEGCEAALQLLTNRHHLAGRQEAFARLAANPDAAVAKRAHRLAVFVAERDAARGLKPATAGSAA